MTTKTCECGAEIFFRRSSKTGKPIPLDAKATVAYVVPDGDLDFPVDPIKVHLNHFVTCPLRDQFRKDQDR